LKCTDAAHRRPFGPAVNPCAQTGALSLRLPTVPAACGADAIRRSVLLSSTAKDAVLPASTSPKPSRSIP